MVPHLSLIHIYDTKPQNWKYKNEFKDNYQTLIDTYRNLKSHPRIILLTPIRCFLPAGSEITAQLIENEVRPTVAVSYTHLDVYTRQSTHLHKNHPTHNISIKQCPPHGLPASFFRRQVQVVSPALKRADCLSVASVCPLAGGNTGVVGKTQP